MFTEYHNIILLLTTIYIMCIIDKVMVQLHHRRLLKMNLNVYSMQVNGCYSNTLVCRYLLSFINF